MALGFSTYQRLERLLLKTRNILGENDDNFKEANKVQALQYAASFYNLYAGDGSETTYTDSIGLTIIQSELIATKAAIELTKSAISYYKDDVVTAEAGPANAAFRTDKLAWLKAFLEELKEKLDELEGKEGVDAGGDAADITVLMGMLNKKVLACPDPPEDVCENELPGAFTKTIGGGCC